MELQEALLLSLVLLGNFVEVITMICSSDPLNNFYLSADAMDDLSRNQRLLTVGISWGKVNPRFASWKIGTLNQVRWLTFS